MANNRKYQFTVNGKTHEVSQANIDKYGWDSYANAYPDATVRMRDNDKADYDVPIDRVQPMMDNGLHPFTIEYSKTTKPLPSKKQEPSEVRDIYTQPINTQLTNVIPPGSGENMPSFYKMPILEKDISIDEKGNRVTSPKLIPNFDPGNGGVTAPPVYRDVLTGKTYDPEDVNVQEAKQFATTSRQLTNVAAQNREQVANLSKEIDAELNRRGKELDVESRKASWGDLPRGSGGAVHTFNASTNNGRLADEEYRNLQAARNSMTDAQRIIDEADHNAQRGTFGKWLESSFAGGATRGFGQKLFDVRTWDLGMSDLSDNVTLLQALDDFDKGRELSRSQQMLLDAKAVEMATQAYFGSYVGRGYQAGSVTAESIPFMVEMCINPLSTTGTAATSKLARYAIKRYGKQAVNRNAKKYASAKIATRIAGDIAGSAGMTATTGSIRTAADALDRMGGQVQFDTNEEGKSVFAGHTDGDNVITAFSKAFAATTIGNHSEMIGAYFAPVLGMVGKYTRKGLGKLGLESVNKFIDDVAMSDAGRLIGDFEKHAKWNGLFSEYAEEVAGNIENALIVGDQTLDTDPDTGVFNVSKNIDTFLGVSLMGGFLSSAKTIGYRPPKYRAKRDITAMDNHAATVFGNQDTWGDIRNTLAFGNDADVQKKLCEVVNNPNYTPEQKQSAMDYAKSVQNYKGILQGENKRRTDAEMNRVQIDAEISFDNGYLLETPQEMTDSKINLDFLRQEASKEFGWNEESVDRYLSGDNSIYNVLGLKESGYSDKQVQKAIDYLNARATYDGMIQHVQDDIESRISASHALIKGNTHLQDGQIHAATMKINERKVYVVNGNIVLNGDGTIDNEHSDESIIIRDAETQNIEFSDPSSILSVDESIDPSQEMRAIEAQIREIYSQEAADKIDGVVPFNPGDIYLLTDEHGGQKSAQIFSADEQNAWVLIDGAKEAVVIPKAELQQMVDYTNLARLKKYHEQKALEEMAIDEQEKEANRPQYAMNDLIMLRDENGNGIRGNITADSDADGRYEVYTEDAVNGKRVNLFTRDELDSMLMEHNGQTIEQPVPEITESLPASGENVQNPTENAVEMPESVPTEQSQVSVLERIPKDEQGNPIYEQAETPDLAWDAIVEQTEGDEVMAKTVADGMVADMEAALKKIEKSKAKGGTTIAEKIAAEKERKAAIDNAKSTLAIWQKIAGTVQRRKSAADAERRRIAEEQAALRKAEEEKLRAEREEAERIEREALNGVPDVSDDTPQDARARGYRRVAGHKIDRQQPIQHLQGKEVEVKFSDKAITNGRVAVIDAGELQPSHIQGMRNPAHFIDEAQPKERNDEVSVLSARKIAGNIRPEEITTSVTAYTGAPTVNTRGEVIQGNNRSDALRLMWENEKEQAAIYKQYLKDHADEFGLNAEEVEAMERPVLVNMLDVEDADALTLGQFVAQDTESGGMERIKPKNAVQKMGADMRTFASLLLKSADDETSFAGLVDNNGAEVLRWMNQRGYITPTQYKSAFNSKGAITAEAKNDLKGIMYQSIFQGGNTRLEEMFNAIPAKAQRAILATAFRDYDSPNSERMVEEIQNSIRAYNALSKNEAFMNAKNWKEARMAVEGWKRQYAMDDVTGESYLPAEKFSNFALHLATMYKGESQNIIQSTFNHLYDLIQGTQEETLFEKTDNTPRTLAQAIKETLNIDYNGQQRSNVLAGDSAASQQREQGSTGNLAPGERDEGTDLQDDNSTGTERNSRQTRDDSQRKNDLSKVEEVDIAERSAMEARILEWLSDDNLAKAFGKTREEIFAEFGNELMPIAYIPTQFVNLVSENIQDQRIYCGKGYFIDHALRNHANAGVQTDVNDIDVSKYLNIQSVLDNPDTIKETFVDGKRTVVFIKKIGRYFAELTQVEENGKIVLHKSFFNQKKEPYAKLNDIRQIESSPEGGISSISHADTAAPAISLQSRNDVKSFSESKSTKKSLNRNELGEKKNDSLVGKTIVHKDGKQKIKLTAYENGVYMGRLNGQSAQFADDLIVRMMETGMWAEEGGSPITLGERIEVAEAETDTNPSDAQKEAGNYKKGHVQIGTFNVTIENPKGSIRSGVDADGNKWETKMQNTYGYIRGTEGVDGDHIDVFLSNDIDDWNGTRVFIIDQYNPDGTFDEHKVMLGFNEQEEAEAAFLRNYDEEWAAGRRLDGSSVLIEDFEKWIASSHRKTKPFAEYKSVKPIRYDSQGNPIDENGNLIIEDVKSIADITDADFTEPTRTVGLPTLHEIVQQVLSTNGKRVIIKKNIFKRNALRHDELTPEISRTILNEALYNPTLYGKNKPLSRPNNWIVINVPDRKGNNKLVVLEVNEGKNNVEIVHWHEADKRGLEKIKRQAEREDGQLLILPSVTSEEAGALSGPTFDSPSDGKVNALSADKQTDEAESSELYTITPTTYTNKAGKTTNVHQVKFNTAPTYEQRKALATFAREKTDGRKTRGWCSDKETYSEWLFRSEKDAHKAGKMIADQSDEAAADAQPMTAEADKPKTHTNHVSKTNSEISDSDNPVRELFSGLIAQSKYNVEIDEDNFDDSESEALVRIILNGERSDLWLYDFEGKTADEHSKGVRYFADGLTYEDAEKLAEEYNEYYGRVVAWDGKDELGVNFSNVDDAIRFTEWLNRRKGTQMLIMSKQIEQVAMPVQKEGEDLFEFAGRVAKENEKKDKEVTQTTQKQREKRSGQKIKDYGEVIAGARKDAMKEIAKGIGNITVGTLITQPLGKVWKKPNLRKMVDDKAITEEEAVFLEAVAQRVVSMKKPTVLKNGTYRRARRGEEIKVWAENTAEKLNLFKEFVEGDETVRNGLIESANTLSFPMAEEEQRAVEKMKELNKGMFPKEHFTSWGKCLTPHPLYVTMQILMKMGYKAGDKVDYPLYTIGHDSAATHYTAYDNTGAAVHRLPSFTNVDEMIECIVAVNKLHRGDSDAYIPVEMISPMVLTRKSIGTGQYRVTYGRGTMMKDRTFKSKAEAEAFISEQQNKGVSTVVHEIEEMRPDRWTVVFFDIDGEKYFASESRYDKENGKRVIVGESFESNEEARRSIEEHSDEWSERLMEVYTEKNAKNDDGNEEKRSPYTLYHYPLKGYAYSISPAKSMTGGWLQVSPFFGSVREAKEWMKGNRETIDAQILKKKDTTMRLNKVYLKDETRKGTDYRGGSDVTPEEFGKTFCFRGVQFGNWTNDADRQAALNSTYDALMDLAEVTGISPKAISLNGELGIAFGARGTGNANAHYERDNVVINLTKTRGAGSLAHEWWHALDSYFARMGGMPLGMMTNMEQRRMVMRNGVVREEMGNAYAGVIDAIEESDFGKRQLSNGKYWRDPVEMSARLFDAWVGMKLAEEGKRNNFLCDAYNPMLAEEWKKSCYTLAQGFAEIRGEKFAETFEEFKKRPEALGNYRDAAPEEVQQLGVYLQGFFDTVQECEGKDGNRMLYRDGGLSLINAQFNEELQQQIDGTLPKGHIYRLGNPGNVLLGTGVPNLPIQLNSTRLIDKATKFGHNYGLEEIKDLVVALQSPIAVFAYGDKSKGQNIIVELSSNDKNFVVGLSLNPTVGGKTLEINSIRNVFPKDNAEWLNWITQEKLLYVDKERIQNLINQQRTILADVDYLDLDSVTKIVENFENPSIEDENLRFGKTHDRPISPRMLRKQMAERVKELVEMLHLDNIEALTNISGLKGRAQKARGFYTKSTGKITIVIPNHTSLADVEQTLLHEAVAHYGLRKMFGTHFDTFLDNVFNHADETVRRRMVDMAVKNGWDFRKATEEYLAGLAERTNFENARKSGWWQRIKQLFSEMLDKLGFSDFRGITLTDNELRYILWRSYENLKEGKDSSLFGEATDVAMQYELKVGNYTPISTRDVALVAEPEETYANERFNKQLEGLTDETADSIILDLGMPSDILLSAGLPSKIMRLFGNKLMKKAKKHKFDVKQVRNLPIAVNNPIAVLKGSRVKSFAILTEIEINGNKTLVTIEADKEGAVDFNLVTSGYGKYGNSVVRWINEGKLLTVDKKKALDYLGTLAPIASAQERQELESLKLISSASQPVQQETDTQDLSSAIKIVENFENPTIGDENNLNDSDLVFKTGEKNSGMEVHGVSMEASKADAVNKRFNEELELYENGKLGADKYVSVGFPHGVMRQFMPDNEIILRQKVLSKARKKHNLPALELRNLPLALSHPIFVFSSTDNHIGVLTEVKTHEGKNVFVAVSLSYQKQIGHRFLEVNDILSVHGREIENIVLPIIEKNSLKWVDKKKGIQWLSSAKTNSQAIAKETLDNATKIVENFENPNIDGENNLNDSDLLFRSEGNNPGSEAQNLYEKATTLSFVHRFDEAWHDHLRSVKTLQESFEQSTGRKTADFENVYLHAMHKSSVDMREINEMQENYVEPLSDALTDIIKGDYEIEGKGIEQEDAECYLNCKHGLERNKKFALRDAKRIKDAKIYELDRMLSKGEIDPVKYDAAKQNAEQKELDDYKRNRERDYSGLTAIFDPEETEMSNAELETRAQEYVYKFEQTVPKDKTDALWNAIGKLTNFSLQKSYLCGNISKQQYNEIRSMFEYYVPLRGFKEETADDVYEYVTREINPFQKADKKASGRTSQADNLFATIMSMGHSAIVQGNKNLVKQKLLNLALNADDPLLSVTHTWYDATTDELCKPNITNNMTAKEQREEVERFDREMKEKEKSGEVIKRSRGLEINRRSEKWQANEHCVRVMRNGMEYQVWVNGNPRAAQAINGILNPDAAKLNMLNSFINKVNRFRAKNVTSLSPEFLISNLQRDIISSNVVGFAKYGLKYFRKFNQNLKDNLSLVDVRGDRAVQHNSIYALYRRYKDGALDMNNKRDRYFAEFIKNGGETGYSQLWTIDDYEKKIKKALRKYSIRGNAESAMSAVGTALEFANRGIENSCRFAAYVTSREMGRSVLESITDAKETSVNFNRKGSGAMGNQIAKSWFMFLNPAIQGLMQYIDLTRKYPKRMLPILGGVIGIGVLMPIVTRLIISAMGGDDEDYYNLSAWTRRNNFVFPIGNNKFGKIALPPEIRAMYGLGEIAYGSLTGHDKYENTFAAIISQLSQLMPLDIVDANGIVQNNESIWKGFAKGITPSMAQPIFESYLWNEDFMGRPITGHTPYDDNLDPEYRKVSRGTLQWLVDASRWMNNATGGTDYSKGWIDRSFGYAFNPSAIEHIFVSYLGGIATFAEKSWKMGGALLGNEEYQDIRNYPFISKMVSSTDNDYAQSSQIDAAYKYYGNEYSITKKQVKGYENEMDNDVWRNAERYDRLLNTHEFKRYSIFEAYKPDINYLIKKLRTTEDPHKKKELAEVLRNLKKELVEKLEATESNK